MHMGIRDDDPVDAQRSTARVRGGLNRKKDHTVRQQTARQKTTRHAPLAPHPTGPLSKRPDPQFPIHNSQFKNPSCQLPVAASIFLAKASTVRAPWTFSPFTKNDGVPVTPASFPASNEAFT